MKRSIVVYPFLFAIFPVLALYVHNIGELYLSSIWIPLGMAFGLAILLFIISWAIFRNALKAGLVATALIIIFFADGHISKVLVSWGFPRVAKYLPIVWVICFIVIVYFVARTRRQLNNVTAILNVIGVGLILVTSINIIVNNVTSPSIKTQNTVGLDTNPSEASTLPDIYYIILDSYENASTLQNVFGYDNSGFVEYLQGKGFYVANESVSNYAYTQASLASSLDMDYINYVSDEVGNRSKALKIQMEMLKNNSVLNSLKSMGYYCVNIESRDIGYNKYADLNIGLDKAKTSWVIEPSSFELTLVGTTLVDRFWSHYPLYLAIYRAYTLNTLDKLAEMPDLKGPKFVFAHVTCPHDPWVFDANGGEVKTGSSPESPGWQQKYVDQVQFINGKIEKLVDEILSKSKTPPVIILQGDHGTRDYDLWYHCKGVTSDQCMQDTFGILNAYYLPNADETLLYEAISPVNSFRVVFNSYFATEYEMLPDECYYSNPFVYPYDFVNVTSEVIHH